MAVMGKRAIDSADALSKTAQKAGVTTEALSRLNYAAGYSDVSLEQLSGGLQKLSRNMAEVASGKGGAAATALSALGISATDAIGNLRDADVVFGEVADRFGRMEDGSTKTALAIQLFGRAGADLIPLLNSGKDGLAAMADESDRLGLTISGKTGRAAEEFNDTLTKVGRIVEGVAAKVAEAALPALQDFADLLSSPQFVEAAQKFGATMVSVLSGITQAIIGVTNAASDLADYLSGNITSVSDADLAKRIANSQRILAKSNPNEGGYSELQNTLQQEMAEQNRRKFQDPVGDGASFGDLGSFGFGTGGGGGGGGGDFDLPTFTDTGAAEAMASRLESLRQSLMTEEQLEMDSHLKRLEEIKGFYEAGAIAKGEQDSLIEGAQLQHSERMTAIAKEQAEKEAQIREALLGNVASVFGSLSSLANSFGEENLAATKAFGVAEAVINTSVGVTKALEQGGMLGFAGAAAVAAAGAAQIATILSTNKGSSSKPSVGGSGASSSAAVAAPSQSGLTIDIKGLTPSAQFSGEQVRGMLEGITGYLGDQGKQIAITYKGS
jgi:hypothetical protein